MPNFITDLKRAWRLTKLIRNSSLSDEDALQVEKIDSIYLEECREIRSDLIRTSEAIRRDIVKAHKSLAHEAGNVRRSFNNQSATSTKKTGKQFSDLENSLSKLKLKMSQALDTSQKTFADNLTRVGDSAQNTYNLVNDVREYVSKQATETRRWQEGYDWHILKNYLTRLISTLDDIETKLDVYRKEDKPEEFLQDFDFLRETLEIHLEEEGVISFAPEIGADVDPLQVDIKGGIDSTSEDQQPETVAEVVKKGYEIDLGAGMKTVRKAQVTVYKK